MRMRLGYSLGSLLSVKEIFECAQILSKYDPDSIWIPETWGMESFSMLGGISQIVKTSKIGSSIINVYSRSPSLTAMGAATVDTISNGRFILGLGSSSVPIVNDFHGVPFEKPVSRMREYIEIIKTVLSGKMINYNGKFFTLKNFSLLIKPPRKEIPIYLAAVNNKMVELAWELANGVIFYLRPISELKDTIQKMQGTRTIEVACQLITCISHDSEKALRRTKKTLAFYIAVGSVYRQFLAKNGFKKETEEIFEEFQKTGLRTIHEFVTDSMSNSLSIWGEPQDCIKKLKKFQETGITLPIIQFNPIENVLESFKLTASTFSGDVK